MSRGFGEYLIRNSNGQTYAFRKDLSTTPPPQANPRLDTGCCGSCGLQEKMDRAGVSQDSPEHQSYVCRACRGEDTGERWILEERSRSGNWRRIPKSDTFETGEDAQVELGRYEQHSLKKRDDFRVRRVNKPIDNPNGESSTALVTGVLVLAAVGITWLMFREKPGKEPAPAPQPTPPPPPPAPPPFVPPVVIPNPPLSQCVVTAGKFSDWLVSKGFAGHWLQNVQVTPPILSVLKTDFPALASATYDKIAVATNNGDQIWYYDATGEPYTHPKIRQQLCGWINAAPGAASS